MQYTPHSHSALIDGTVAALLWEAADYLASEPETPVDPLSRIGDEALNLDPPMSLRRVASA